MTVHQSTALFKYLRTSCLLIYAVIVQMQINATSDCWLRYVITTTIAIITAQTGARLGSSTAQQQAPVTCWEVNRSRGTWLINTVDVLALSWWRLALPSNSDSSRSSPEPIPVSTKFLKFFVSTESEVSEYSRLKPGYN